jgi:hypothetical protein
MHCCESMANQFSSKCKQHGVGCHVVVDGGKHRRYLLRAENAKYAFFFCPWCGKRVQEELTSDEKD